MTNDEIRAAITLARDYQDTSITNDRKAQDAIDHLASALERAAEDLFAARALLRGLALTTRAQAEATLKLLG